MTALTPEELQQIADLADCSAMETIQCTLFEEAFPPNNLQGKPWPSAPLVAKTRDCIKFAAFFQGQFDNLKSLVKLSGAPKSQDGRKKRKSDSMTPTPRGLCRSWLIGEACRDSCPFTHDKAQAAKVGEERRNKMRYAKYFCYTIFRVIAFYDEVQVWPTDYKQHFAPPVNADGLSPDHLDAKSVARSLVDLLNWKRTYRLGSEHKRLLQPAATSASLGRTSASFIKREAPTAPPPPPRRQPSAAVSSSSSSPPALESPPALPQHTERSLDHARWIAHTTLHAVPLFNDGQMDGFRAHSRFPDYAPMSALSEPLDPNALTPFHRTCASILAFKFGVQPGVFGLYRPEFESSVADDHIDTVNSILVKAAVVLMGTGPAESVNVTNFMEVFPSDGTHLLRCHNVCCGRLLAPPAFDPQQWCMRCFATPYCSAVCKSISRRSHLMSCSLHGAYMSESAYFYSNLAESSSALVTLDELPAASAELPAPDHSMPQAPP